MRPLPINPGMGASGKKIPDTATESPGLIVLVISPRSWTVIERGVDPGGTSKGSSCSLTSWYLTNLEPRVCRCSTPPPLPRPLPPPPAAAPAPPALRAAPAGRAVRGVKTLLVTSW